MSSTINRRLYSVDLPNKNQVRNYFFNQNAFKGIIEDKNFLETDPLSFSDAKNVYVDPDGVFKSRPSIKKIKTFENEETLKIWEFSELGKTIRYFAATVNSFIEYFITDSENTLELWGNNEPIVVQVKNDIYAFVSALDDFGTELYVWKLTADGFIPADVYIPITTIKYGESSINAEPKNILIGSYRTRYLISDLDNIPDELKNNDVTIQYNNINYTITNFNKYSIFNKVNGIVSKQYYSYFDTFWCGKSGYIKNIVYNDNIIVNYFFNTSFDIITLTAYKYTGDVLYTLYITNVISLPVLCDDGTTLLISGDIASENFILNKISIDGALSATIITNNSAVDYVDVSFTNDGSRKYFFVGDAINEYTYSFVRVFPYALNDSAKPYGMIRSVIKNNNGAPYQYSLITGNNYFNSSNTPNIYATKLFIVDNKINLSMCYECSYPNNDESAILYTFGTGNCDYDNFEFDSQTYFRARTNNDPTLGNINDINLLLVFEELDSYGSYAVALVSKLQSVNPNVYHFIGYTQGEDEITFNIHISISDYDDDDLKSISLINNHTMYNYYAITNIATDGAVPINIVIDGTDIYISEIDAINKITIPNNITVLPSAIISKYYLAIDANNAVYTNYVSPYNPLIVDTLTEGGYTAFTPDHESYLSEYYFSQGNKLYVSSTGIETTYKVGTDSQIDVDIKHDTFQWYLPENNVNEFDNDITYLHPISATEMAVFFENEIYYTKYDIDLGAYRAYKTMQQVGLVEGAEVITTFDTKYVVFSSQRGLVAMSYQQFIASTEQALTFLSDTIHDTYKAFNTRPVKLYKFDYWLVAYHKDEKGAYLYDIRNNSWWYWESNKQIRQLYTHIDKSNNLYLVYPHLFDNNSTLYLFNRDETQYYDDGHETISWFFTSQRLPFALNYYKHIINLTLVSLYNVEELKDIGWSDYKIGLNLRTLIYRKSVTNGELKPQSINYNIDFVRTYILRLNYSKVEEFQYQIESDDTNKHALPLSLVNLTIKYSIGSQVR